MTPPPLKPAALKPAALHPGANLTIVSPASTPKAELVQQGIDRLHALGYRTVLSPHALDKGPLYFAGTLEHRVAELHAAFADPSIDGILCTRGGWGSAELLPYLDAALIRSNPKLFIGYSDHTSLHCWLRQQTGLISLYGPMVASDFGRDDGVDLPSWHHSVEGSAHWSLTAADGLRILRPGIAEGTLHGGCLSIFAEALGTPYAPQPIENSILFLEDIGTKPYQWDRMLLHLRYAGLLEGVRGIVFGDMLQCVPLEEHEFLERAILHALRDFTGPIAIGLRSGHVDPPNITLPLGVSARLDLSQTGHPQLHLLEPAVTA
jgi:muramoyltetrapeptide carboxypeptidase